MELKTAESSIQPVCSERLALPTREGPGTRYHHLDAVRAFALILGVFFHAAESFGARNDYWAVVDSRPSEFLEGIRFACHSFRLELFFVIAGFFARFLLVRRGTAEFVINRLQRILVPLVVGWAVLYPVLVALWVWGASVSGRLAQFGIPPEALQFPVWKLTLGFFLSGGFLQKFDLTHLWFLHQLSALYVVVLGIRWFFLRWQRGVAAMARLDTVFARLQSWPVFLFCLLLPSVPMLLLMKTWVVYTPKESLVPDVATTLLFGYCFLVGWLWQRQPHLLDSLARRWAWYMAAGALAWGSFFVLQDKVHWSRPWFSVLYAHMMWGFVLGFLGLFTRVCRRPNAWTRYVADASYWIYIVHLPLVVALQVLLWRTNFPWPVKYSCICVVTLVLVFTTYHYFVRATLIGQQLNGHRYARLWPWQKVSHATSNSTMPLIEKQRNP